MFCSDESRGKLNCSFEVSRKSVTLRMSKKMKTPLPIAALFCLLFNSCSAIKFVTYYAGTDTRSESSNGGLTGNFYEAKGTSYTIGYLPPTWKRIKIKGGDLAFWNESLDSTITVNSTCDKNKTRYSLKALSNSLVIGVKDKSLVESSEFIVSGEKALHRTYLGKLSEDQIKMSTVVLKKGSCIYDFSYVSKPDNFEGGFDQFNNFVSQFRIIR